MKTVTVSGTEYRLKWTNKMIILYEEMSGKSFFDPDGGKYMFKDLCVLMYCCLISNNETFQYKFSQFIDMLDAEPQLMTDFVKWFANENALRSQIMAAEEDKKKE